MGVLGMASSEVKGRRGSSKVKGRKGKQWVNVKYV
jgi:hypothetical protein